MRDDYAYNVFINCPFDRGYRPIFQAIVFTVIDCGFKPLCAMSIRDAGEARVAKICRLIRDCGLGVHDLSRTQLDPINRLPRFNMPFELGLFLGAKEYGDPRQKRKNCLIMDRERHRFQKFISDIAGQDIAGHESRPEHAIRAVRDWLRDSAPRSRHIPGGAEISARYERFRRELPRLCRTIKVRREELTYVDYTHTISLWLKMREA